MSSDKYPKNLPLSFSSSSSSSSSLSANNIPSRSGSAQYCYNLGKCYYYGYMVVKDRSKAVRWFWEAALQGHAAGQYRLAKCYLHGYGAAEDKREAFRWYRAAAEQGYAPAQNDLAACYLLGYGVTEDRFMAYLWYGAAAAQGYSFAQNNLGVCYAKGWGVAKNEKKAAELYYAAAVQGSPAALKNLIKLNKKIAARNISVQSSAIPSNVNVNSFFSHLLMPASTPVGESKESAVEKAKAGVVTAEKNLLAPQELSAPSQPKKPGMFG